MHSRTGVHSHQANGTHAFTLVQRKRYTTAHLYTADPPVWSLPPRWTAQPAGCVEPERGEHLLPRAWIWCPACINLYCGQYSRAWPFKRVERDETRFNSWTLHHPLIDQSVVRLVAILAIISSYHFIRRYKYTDLSVYFKMAMDYAENWWARTDSLSKKYCHSS